ncbi:transglutaminase-like domain-containing protein [Microbacterium terricola]|uniref:Cysteine protease n=1 Tax=Microbacterium terricola TaxID=344163 RepID=A0ABM8DW08_9MICO|nr:transglutaminase-like domain-containing protein [Microbacterium terricola]UYK39565.1 DUF3488 and transglutaminase-like domain-containing protein [Microbacterium terricola]BDV29700.1 cysteine protease [Microbacterium terricola]
MSAALPPVAPEPERVLLVPRVVAGSLFVALTVLTAAVAAWPIYRSWWFVLLVGVATIVAVAIAAFAWWRRWAIWRVLLVVTVAFFVLGIPLAVPSRLGGPADLVQGLGDVAAGAVLAWKDMLTVDLPVGSYRNLLVPALVIFLVGTCAALLLSWRRDRWAYVAAPVGLSMIAFGLFFGRTTVSASLVIGQITLRAPVETAIAIVGLLTCLLWLAWRSRDERVRALQRAAVSSGVRISRRPSRTDRRRGALGAGMIALAVAIAAIVVPYAARGADREVLRSGVGPEIDLSAEVSPLSAYRGMFTDERAGEILFTVVANGTPPERVRVATLDSYDGEIFRAGGSDAIEQSRFVRVPSSLDAGAGEQVDVQITVDTLDGIWMPSVGRLSSATFTGPRAASLRDDFYYSATAQAGVQTAAGGLRSGDAFRLTGVEPAQEDLASLTAPGGIPDDVTLPENLRAWVAAHATGTDGAALAELVALLRSRGYLSHSLSEGEEAPVWAESLGGYEFQPSASGHSLARIDRMFERLLDREADPRAQSSDNYVAAIGDDEQFAVATALIARTLGFPARVVVGVRLSADDPGLRTCEGGVCRAQDLAAWTEVRGTDGSWVPIDVTPQYSQSPSLDRTEQRDPENATEVRPDAIEEVVPPAPLQDDPQPNDEQDADAGLDLAWLWPILRIAGIALALLALAFGPFLIIIGAKAGRRRSRRRQPAPAARVAGGWDEYVDAAVDAGREAPPSATRSELAAAFATAAGDVLAAGADRAVFSRDAVSAEEARAFWRTVDEERRALRRASDPWRRFAAAVSLRSFVRHLGPSGQRKRLSERGKRRPARTARTA